MNRRSTASLWVMAAGAAAVLLGAIRVAKAAESLETAVDTPNDRLIIVTIANEPGPPLRAGSTSRSYGGLLTYQASTAARRVVVALAEEYQLRLIEAWPIAVLHVHCVVFEIPASSSRQQLLRRLARDKRVTLAQPMNTFRTLSARYNDPYVSLQHAILEIDVPEAHQWSLGSRVRVAVIDSGMDIAHPDLRDRVVLHRNFVDTNEAQFERDRHGTEVAGVIAAVANNREGIVGVAPRVQLLALKACSQIAPGRDDARCSSIALAQALVAAIDAGAQVVNLSLIGPFDPLLAALLAHGVHRGMIYVAPVVDTPGSLQGFPAEVAGVLGVACFEEPPARHDVLLAPGRDILTLLPGGRYDFASGASLAAAHVSGTVALLLARNPRLGAATIQAVLRRTSTYLGEVRAINACVALVSIVGGSRCTAPAHNAALADAPPPLMPLPLAPP